MESHKDVKEKEKRSPHGPDVIIEGGLVLTMAEGTAPIENGRILISDGIIVDVQGKPYDVRVKEESEAMGSDAEFIDAKGCLVMPGIINAHTHSAMTLFRGYADDLPLKKWLFEKIFPAEAKYLNEESVYWGSLLACMEMIRNGTTSFVDGYFYQNETLRAAHQAGLRGLIAQGVIDFPAPGVPDPSENLKRAQEFIERWYGLSDLITPAIFCHSPVTCSETTLEKARKISDDFGLPLLLHLSETMDEVGEILNRTGMRPVIYLDKMGLMDSTLIAAHAVHVDEGEMEILSEKRVKVVHLPESNMKLCSGISPVKKMIQKGVTVALGTDGCSSNNDLDMFLEMDTAAKISKVYDSDPVGLDARTVMKMATLWGADFPCHHNNIGTIVKGKRADIIVIDLKNPHLCPVYDPYSLMVYSASGADVRDVIVDGRILMKNRGFLTLDCPEVIARVKEICKNFGEKA